MFEELRYQCKRELNGLRIIKGVSETYLGILEAEEANIPVAIEETYINFKTGICRAIAGLNEQIGKIGEYLNLLETQQRR